MLAYLIWTLGDASAKWVLPSVGVAGAMLWRGVFGLATVAAITLRPHTPGWRKLVPRPQHPDASREVQEAFKKSSAIWCAPSPNARRNAVWNCA